MVRRQLSVQVGQGVEGLLKLVNEHEQPNNGDID